MADNVLVNASLDQASEILYETILAIFETIDSANSVLIQKENFDKFSTYLERIIFFLREFSKLDTNSSDSLKNAVDILNGEIKVAKQLALNCSNRNKIYLLINCRKIVEQLQGCTEKISQALGLISLAFLDGSLVINDEISKLCRNMLDIEYSMTRAEEEILVKIESGIEERNVDRSYANDLLIRIAEAAGISTEQTELKREFEALKSEMDNDELREDMTEPFQMERIIALLSKADMITTLEEKGIRYLNKRNSLGRQQLEPLQSFYCPISGDIMVDPVETSSGHTFERSAIEKWLEEGNDRCPLTNIPLNISLLRSNKTLRESIEEWKDRNAMIMIASMKLKIQSNMEQEVLHSLGKLQELCIERELHREWIIMEDYIPILIGLLAVKNLEIRKHALDILCILAKDNDDNKERIAKVDNAIESIVHSLARKVEEAKLALQLLLELSRMDLVRNIIGNVQGCILLLVSLSSNDDTQAAKDARELLDNLSFNDENVVQMAKANYFRPLLHFLSSGPETAKVSMAKMLSEVELTDHSKLSLFRDGAQWPLLQFLSHEDVEVKEVVVKTLRNLSSIPQNGLQMIREGAVRPLFELLYCHRLSSPTLREQVAATIMHLAISSTLPEADQMKVSIFESEEDIFKFFSLISLTGPDVQQSILQTFIAMCQSSYGFEIRNTLRQISASRVLVQLSKLDNCTVRTGAVKLLYYLTEDGNDTTFLEHVNPRYLETLLRIVENPNKVEETAAAMGIISNLPQNSQMNQWLLDAGALQVIANCLANGDSNASHRREVVETASGALCRFTVPTNQECQKKAAEAGCIPVLVGMLVSGTASMKRNAAISLKQFSESSSSLSRPVRKPAFFGCCSAPPEAGCSVHTGICTVESSFCLVEAEAVRPLVRVVEEQDSTGACEASLDALLTLIEGDQLQRGSRVLAEVNAIVLMIKLLSSSSASLQERALKALERIFQLVEFKQRYGTSAQLPLVDITQRGTGSMKSLAAKTLAHMNLLQDQSSFF